MIYENCILRYSKAFVLTLEKAFKGKTQAQIKTGKLPNINTAWIFFKKDYEVNYIKKLLSKLYYVTDDSCIALLCFT